MLPALFVSRGTPALPFSDSPAKRFLSGLSGILPKRPSAILVVSADAEPPGFTYRPPGALVLAERAEALLRAAGIVSEPGPIDAAAGPLSLMYPNADIPVARLSLARDRDPLHHLSVGRALAPLRREDGVLILGSGSFTRGEPLSPSPHAPEAAWVSDFARWTHAALHGRRHDDLLAYRTRAPFAERNHPSGDHLSPLFVALGAAGPGAEARRLHASVTHGVLRMDVYAFRSPRL